MLMTIISVFKMCRKEECDMFIIGTYNSKLHLSLTKEAQQELYSCGFQFKTKYKSVVKSMLDYMSSRFGSLKNSFVAL